LLPVIEGGRPRPGRKIYIHMENRLQIKGGMEKERDRRLARHHREENPGEQIMFLAGPGCSEAVILVEKGLQLHPDQRFFISMFTLKRWLPIYLSRQSV
jgi:hypothetical protein